MEHKIYQIHSYKHDGSIHRVWEKSVLLDETDEYIILGNNKCKVIESDGRTWYTKEPAIIYFFKNKWYNIIAMYKKRGLTYYCNISSPCVIEENTVKYIDYDLDLKIFPNNSYKILDRDEYEYHKEKMMYPTKLDSILNLELKKLIDLKRNGDWPFQDGVGLYYLNLYKQLIGR